MMRVKIRFFIVLLVCTFALRLNTHLAQQEPQIHTIVIGAGIAGMAAASQLAKEGHHVVVLEANSYIGGRLKTKPIKLSDNTTFQYEEGANWIHGSNPDHPITKLSQSIAGVQFVETDDESIINYSEDKENVDDEVEAEGEPYENILENMEEFQNTSVLEAIKQLDEGKLKNKFFMSLVSHDIEFQTASSINLISARHGFEDASYEGEQKLVISGYQNFAIYLSRNPNIKVHLNHKVSEVIFDGSKTIVRCENGNTFTASFLVSAVPLGVLKSGSIRFTPSLPAWKEEAIRSIDFGNVCKILIVLKRKLTGLKEHYIGVIPDDVQQRGSAAYFLNIQALTGLPALMTFGLGPSADELETMPQEQLKDLIADRLNVFSDSGVTADDFQIARSGWKGNSNFRGAYSSAGVITQPSHWKNMAKPVFGVNWFFCGEHTNSNHRGTVHGAYESGVNTASDILNNIDSNSWEQKDGAEDDD